MKISLESISYSPVSIIMSLLDSIPLKDYRASHTMELSNATLEENKIKFEIFRDTVNGYFGLLQITLVIFGTIGNLLSIIVINRKPLRIGSSSVFITFLAVFDTMVLLMHTVRLYVHPKSWMINCAMTISTDFWSFCAFWTLVVITLGKL